MTTLTQRHDISDHLWALLEPHLPGQAGQWGGIAHDNRRFINGVLWILRTGAPWRDLPEVYGDWKIRIDAFVAGETKDCGNPCSIVSLTTRIMNG